MGRTVLAYQFVAGLLPDIRIKVAGTEGTFDQLLMKARFEEAKLRDLGPLVQTPTRPLGMLAARPSDCFCDSTAPRPVPDASVSKIKSTLKFGNAEQEPWLVTLSPCRIRDVPIHRFRSVSATNPVILTNIEVIDIGSVNRSDTDRGNLEAGR